MEDKVTQYLNAIYQNTKTAMQSIKNIIQKSKDESLTKELSQEEAVYASLAEQ